MRVLFVNAGILGMTAFSKFIREAMAHDPEIEALHINLSEDLRFDERLIRHVLCARFWPDDLFGVRNLDLARFRREYHAGLQAARRIRRVLSREIVDVIHFHRQTTAYASLALLRRVPSIVSIDSTQDIVIDGATSNVERWSYWPNAERDGRIFSAAAAIVSTSAWAARCLRSRYPSCTTPVHVLPPPVRLQYFSNEWIADRHTRGVPGYMPRVLFVGGDFPRKGGHDLLEVWRSAELYRRANLDLVTDWPLPPIDLPGVRVIRGVASYSAEWSDLWNAADVFAMPTRNEAFGNVFLEAAAAGLPRIGTRTCAVPEAIAEGKTGLLIEPGDRAALTAALDRLIGSRDLRRDLGRAARDYVAAEASPAGYKAKLREIILSIAPAPSCR